MKISGTVIHTLKTGEKVLILLAENKEAQEKLYHYLLVDAYQFKKEISGETLRVDFISAGYKDSNDKVFYNENLIDIPKWFDMN